MKVVILAGGTGSRLSEETQLKPKPMVTVGGNPMLWHIMKIYAAHGLTEFVVCCGYRGYQIKEYFANYRRHRSDLTIDLSSSKVTIHRSDAEPWRVTLVDTGEETMTGGRLKRVAPYLGPGPFCFTYGDGVADVDVKKLVAFHKKEGRLATITCVQPPGRFGAVVLQDGKVSRFQEKPRGDGGMINGGFFVLSPKVLDYIEGDATVWEQEPLKKLASEGQLAAYRHDGFWQCMDTVRDRNHLEELWASGRAPWAVWR
ncbi:MAG TPA: glucose-1-phosphate cytidylyltransferase [Elusimicrobiota bacterium]|nr:glucose-1-phosphate cytidylyltransferase [Elusimicrobiota bacterium]